MYTRTQPKPTSDPDVPRTFSRLSVLACRALDSEKVRDFLWRHTRSPEHYDALMDALRLICDPGLVEWK